MWDITNVLMFHPGHGLLPALDEPILTKEMLVPCRSFQYVPDHPSLQRHFRVIHLNKGGSLTTMKSNNPPKLTLSQETLRLLVTNKPGQYAVNNVTTFPWCPTGAGPNGGQR
jgi:hypothetical protein